MADVASKREAAWDALRRASAEIGIEPARFGRDCFAIGWTVTRLAEEMARPGWRDRFKAALAARRRKDAVASAIRVAFGSTGPLSMLELGDAELLELVPSKLRRVALEHKPDDGGILVLGPTGIGKTAFCASLGRRLVSEADDQLLRTPEALFGWARAVDLANARLLHPLGSEAPAVAAAKLPRTLVIDDLAWEREKDLAISEVIAARYDAGFQTFVTSGRTWEQLVDRYGEAVLRRVLESGGVKGKYFNLFGKAGTCG